VVEEIAAGFEVIATSPDSSEDHTRDYSNLQTANTRVAELATTMAQEIRRWRQ
jgi:hypothetical protein